MPAVLLSKYMETNDTKQNSAPQNTAPVAPAPAVAGKSAMPEQRRGRGGADRGGRKGPSREPRAKPEFDQKIISIRRVTRVAAGGRRFTFSVAVVAGNRKGWVGVGTGKAGDTTIAIDKAMRNAKKHMLKLNLSKDMSIPYSVNAKYCSGLVEMRPNYSKGLVAGSSVRSVLELGGVKNVTGKLLSGTKNPLNNARAAIRALSEFDGKNAHKILVKAPKN